MADQRSDNPATTWLAAARFGDPGRNPIAFLPSSDCPEGTVRFRGAVDYQWPYGRHAQPPSPDDLPVFAAARSAVSHPEQDDLTRHDRDYELTNTPKLGPDDEGLEQPPQDPDWQPTGDTA